MKISILSLALALGVTLVSADERALRGTVRVYQFAGVITPEEEQAAEKDMQEAAIIQSEKDSEGHRLHEGEMREDPNFLGHAPATDGERALLGVDLNTPEKEQAVENDMKDAAIIQSEKDSEGHRLHEGEMREDPNYLGHKAKPTREEIKARRDLQRAKMTAKRELAEAKRQEKTSAIVAAKRKEADAKRALAEAQKELKAIVDSDIGHRGCGKLNIC